MRRVNDLRTLPFVLGAEQIKICAYQFNVRSSGDTDLDIDDDGRRVLLRSSTAAQLEQDFRLLLEIGAEALAEGADAGDEAGEANEEQGPLLRFGAPVAASWRPDPLFRSSAFLRGVDGRLALRGAAAELVEALDRRFRELGRRWQAEAFHGEPTWRADDLPAFGHDVASPFLLRVADHQSAANPDYWQNAVCNGIWRQLADREFSQPRVLTARGTCCRHEGGQHFALEYLRAFAMREIVMAGAPAAVLAFREQAIEAVVALAEAFELHGRVEPANDPFFLEGGAGQERGQRDEAIALPDRVKAELRLALYDGRSLACASFNVHGDFFARRLGYRGGDDGVWTSCVAFGLERWVWAILVQHGPDPSRWPATLQEMVAA